MRVLPGARARVRLPLGREDALPHAQVRAAVLPRRLDHLDRRAQDEELGAHAGALHEAHAREAGERRAVPPGRLLDRHARRRGMEPQDSEPAAASTSAQFLIVFLLAFS